MCCKVSCLNRLLFVLRRRTISTKYIIETEDSPYHPAFIRRSTRHKPSLTKEGLAAVIDNLISVVMFYRKHFTEFLGYCVKNDWCFVNDYHTEG